MSLSLSSKSQVMRQKIREVVGDDPFKINNLLDDKYKPRERHVIVSEARRMVGSPGDLIEISRGGYQHWAVYIGGDEVVHLTTSGE
ncbi:Retinoic acid receptor responder protein 3 [Liparis tanakae]|uniref:Retinoic acid receptor responder protein 3 n=1 Tax=Liparis tanakae TaxID=230148 RepID=A0A4Z2E8D7_9TELE|nr:Retinoic acid receptor responder protein 3 [Liparis tanakae]